MAIGSIQLTHFLSYGEALPFELSSLNVLIGPNGSGKSNLIEAVALLQSLPRDVRRPINRGGGIDEWTSKLRQGGPTSVTVKHSGNLTGTHQVRLYSVDGRLEVFDLFEGFAGMQPDDKDYIRHDQSALAQLRGPKYSAYTALASYYESIRIYRNWVFGLDTPARQPQPPDLPSGFLEEDGSNLALVLQEVGNLYPELRRSLLAELDEIYDGIEDAGARIVAGKVQAFLREEGLGIIPAGRLSDGTIRYLCLLTILCHPSPPPLVCIEEPEIGLHPDMLRRMAKLLIAASSRTQLIVTTHSDILVSGLSEAPGSVVVCSRDRNGSHLERIDTEKLREDLEESTLGELWRSGEIGGNRW
ncbi:MAG: AAA family ATPase [Bryobacteraceae bacterium]